MSFNIVILLLNLQISVYKNTIIEFISRIVFFNIYLIMHNKDKWLPSKYVFRNGKLRASKNKNEVSIFSRVIADLVANFYFTYLGKYAKGKLLDLGCGHVPLYNAYKNFIEDNICIDWDNSYNKNIYLDYSADLNLKLPLNDNDFDTIILSDVLEHIKNPFSLWEEMNRVLKQDGTLLMNVPFYYALHEEPYDYFRYTKHSLKSMAEDNGFHVLYLEPIGGIPEILADIISKSLSQIPLFGNVLALVIQQLTWIFINTKIGKKISNVSSHKFPFGYTMIARKVS